MKANFLLLLPSCASLASLTASSRSALCIPFCASFRDFMHLDACEEEPRQIYDMEGISTIGDIYRTLMEPKVNCLMNGRFQVGTGHGVTGMVILDEKL